MTTWLFAHESPRCAALMRIGLAATLLVTAAARWRYAIELYSTFGPAMPLFAGPDEVATPTLKQSGGASAGGRFVRSSGFHAPIPDPHCAVLLHTGLIFALAAVLIGWKTRTSLWLAVVLFAWLAPLDLPATFAKHSVIALHLLVLLSFTRCGAVWSVDAATEDASAAQPLSPVWPRRLMQLLLCSIYFQAALTKIRSPAFANGDLLTFSLLDDHFGGGRFGLWLSTLPHVPQTLSLATVLIELLFPFLIWVGACRRTMLVVAAAMHALMWTALDLGTFTCIMFVLLLSFADERDLRFLGGRPYPRPGNRPLRWGWYFACLGLFVAAGWSIQYGADWYGAFGRRRLEPPSTIAAADFEVMRAQRGLAPDESIHRIDLGTRIGGNQVFGSRTKMRIGDTAYVLAQLIVPHPPLTLEGLLIAPDGREAARFSHRIEPAVSYSINGFELTDELPPGTYRIVLQVDGYEFARRRIEIIR